MREIVGLGGVAQAFGSVELLLDIAGLRQISCKILVVPGCSIMYPIILGNAVLTNEMITVDLLNCKLSQPLITGCCDICLGSEDSQPDIIHHQIPLCSAEDIWITKGDLSWFLFVSRRLGIVIIMME